MNPQITMPPAGTNPESYTQPLQYDQFGRPDARSLVGFQPNRMTPEQMAAMTQGFNVMQSGFNQAQMPQQMQQGSP